MSSVVIQWLLILALLVASSSRLVVEAKVFERCELAKELHQRHHLDLAEVAQLVCIAKHSSGFNTAAQAKSLTGGSHGLFQISDVYWCSPPGHGVGCNIPCHMLKDEDLSDDLSCVKLIFAEHQRISGDGFTAWNAYEQHCKHEAATYIQDCFLTEHQGSKYFPFSSKNYNAYGGQFSGNAIEDYAPKKSAKVYGRCELARELHNKHKMPMQQIPTWVCIAEHESRFNTAAVGRSNDDGSADHGLFQISDLYWCSHDRYSTGGKACGLSCSKLLDNDITDDVHCARKIHREHTALSGDGFSAWTVYKPYCQHQQYAQIANCFTNNQQTNHPKSAAYGLEVTSNQIPSNIAFSAYKSNPFLRHIPPPTYNEILETPAYFAVNRGVSRTGKVYTRCSLAQELYFKHNFPIQDIPTWVCVAEHASQFNTTAIGHLNTDGSTDYGLFQINDRYWCDRSAYGGKACNLQCDKLLDEDLEDDVSCINIIHEEHTRLSADGFNAWPVYRLHCQNQSIEHIKTCFDGKILQVPENIHHPSTKGFNGELTQRKGKIYNKCDLARELFHKHDMPMEQIPKWVCIAEYESSFNTAAVGRLNTDGSADHGLFQISDLYWCNHELSVVKACKIPCHKFLDSDITDDVECIKIIYEEHTRISGDGFNAWTVYQPHCSQKGIEHIKKCFTPKDLKRISNQTTSNSNSLVPHTAFAPRASRNGRTYKKCELAQELYHSHNLPLDQIAIWVCIAQHESSYNTAAVGRLNTDGSADHGIFQISDLYWCSHDHYGGKACNIPCDKLLDADLTDDVKCIQTIYEEHSRLSGDGFNAWTVYKPHCRNTGISHIKNCFSSNELLESKISNISISTNSTPSTTNTAKGKIYNKCELANELITKHGMPMAELPTWICIAQHESSFNTAAIGRLNTDGSLDHGLFQISDLYWCSHDRNDGKACNIPCDNLLDADITDDVECIKIIYDEHSRISGDGFNAWSVYKPHCHNQKMEELNACFSPNQLADFPNIHRSLSRERNVDLQQRAQKASYTHNPFLSGFNLKPLTVGHKSLNINDFKDTSLAEKPTYGTNPSVQNIRKGSGRDVYQTMILDSNGSGNSNQQNLFLNGLGKSSPSFENYQQNPFLKGYKKTLPTVEKYQQHQSRPHNTNNPSFNGYLGSKTANKFHSQFVDQISGLNPFVSQTTVSSTVKPSRTLLQDHQSLIPTLTIRNEKNANYLNSNDFRKTTTTTAPKPATIRTTKQSSTGTTIQTTAKVATSSFTVGTNTTIKSPFASIVPKISAAISTENPAVNISSTKSAKTTTTWSWLNLKSTTTKTPKIAANWKTQMETFQNSTTVAQQISHNSNWQNKIYNSLTTAKPPKATIKNYQSFTNSKSIETTTTRQVKNQNYTNNTMPNLNVLQKQTISSANRTATKNDNTNWNSRNKQKSTTTNPFIATSNLEKWHKTITEAASRTTTAIYATNNWSTEQNSTATKSLTSTENWKKWDKFTTKKPITTAVRAAINWKNEPQSTTTKPLTTTENLRKWNNTATTNVHKIRWNSRNEQKTTTTKSFAATANLGKWDKTATKRPNNTTTNIRATTSWSSEQKTTATENWRKWDKSTTTKNDKTSWNWRNEYKTSTTKPFTTTGNWRKWNDSTTKIARDTTQISANNFRSMTTTKQPTGKATKANTAKPFALETKQPHSKENFKTTTHGLQSITKSFPHKNLTMPTQKLLTTKFATIDRESNKRNSDPFNHPFFAKVNEQLKQWRGTTTKSPSLTATTLKSFPESLLRRDIQETNVSYSLGNSKLITTTKRPSLSKL